MPCIAYIFIIPFKVLESIWRNKLRLGIVITSKQLDRIMAGKVLVRIEQMVYVVVLDD
jgi:hypothetical protein